MKVRSDGVIVGEIEQTNGGRWFADYIDSTGDVSALGAFETRTAAALAILARVKGDKIVGRIKPIIQLGSRAQGMDITPPEQNPKYPAGES